MLFFKIKEFINFLELFVIYLLNIIGDIMNALKIYRFRKKVSLSETKQTVLYLINEMID